MKDRIVTAAEHVFAQMGTEKATLRDITALAKVNVAAVSGKRLKYQDYRFSVAPMMDWTESSSFSTS
jgi:hypothetical protein